MMKKRVAFFSFVLVLLLILFPSALADGKSGKCGENVTWALDDSGTLTISGTGPMDDYVYIAAYDTPTPWDSFIKSIHTVVVEKWYYSHWRFFLH